MAKATKVSSQRAASKGRSSELDVQVKPFGPTLQTIDEIATRLLQQRSVQTYLARSRHRLLSIEALEGEEDDNARRAPVAPERFRATLYDYTN